MIRPSVQTQPTRPALGLTRTESLGLPPPGRTETNAKFEIREFKRGSARYNTLETETGADGSSRVPKTCEHL